MSVVKLSSDQEQAWDMIKKRKNIFITARAGAGKSYLINYIKEHFVGNVIVCASTGIAATNVGGRTIHSQFMLGHTIDLSDSLEKINKSYRRKRALQMGHLLIIDEVSMVSDILLDSIDILCREVRGVDKPFGGMRVALFGDFIQLPPVFKGDNREGTLCIGCRSWVDADIQPFLLTTNFRQGADKGFYNILTRIRYNLIDDATLRKLSERELEPPEDAVRLYATNNEVDIYNAEKYDELDINTERRYMMSAYGEKGQIENWKKNSLVVEDLRLRIGARVMMLVNKDLDGGYLYNGALGYVVGYRDRYPVVQFDCGINYLVEKEVWEVVEKVKDARGVVVDENVVVRIEQVPLKLAWAATIHKSQGQTFNKVFVDCTKLFVEGQAYVAISRATSLDGLWLRGFKAERARSKQSMVNWYLQLEKQARGK